MTRIASAQFRKMSPKILDEVYLKGSVFIITKRGKEVAKISPINKTTAQSPLGKLKGTIQYKGNITEPRSINWEADERNLCA